MLSLLVLVTILALPLLPVTGTHASVTKLDRMGAVSYSDDLDDSESDAGWGNRTGETLNGALAQRLGYDAANAVVTATTPAGTALYGYDGAGNLLGDGTNTYSYDALSRLMALTPLSGTAPTESYGYNGDGTLVTQTVGTAATQYTQDLAAPSGQSQVLAATTGTGAPVTTDYLYGNGTERLERRSSSRMSRQLCP